MISRSPSFDFSQLAPGRRHAAIAVSLMSAVLLNAAAIGMATQRTRLASPTGPATAGAMLVMLPPTPARPAQAQALPLTVTPQHTPPSRPAEPIEVHPTEVVLPPEAMPIVNSALDLPSTDEALAQPVRFYTFNEVDRAAEPNTDWPIDVETLDAIGIARLVFEVLVDDQGGVISCTVLDPSGLPEAARIDLEQRLAATSLRPALRGGRFVASQRRIELLIEPAT